MNWLLWKEYRLQRLVLVVGLLLLVLPYSYPLLATVFEEPTLGAWQAVPVFSLICSILTLSLLGGNAIASERFDRSAEFQAYQPVSRRTIVLSKLAFPLTTMIVVWGANLGAFLLANRWTTTLHLEPFLGLGLFALAGLCAFGVAWLVSSLQNSPTFAAAAGILAPSALASCISFLSWLTPIEEIHAVIGFALSATLLGLLGLIGGVSYYLRRVEP